MTSRRGGLFAALALACLGALPAFADRVALKDGTTMEGAVVVDVAGKTIVVASTKGGMQVKDKVAFDKALAVETAEQRITWLAPDADVVEASRVLWLATERARYLEWTDRALKAGDGAKASRLLDAAEKRGATGFAVKSRRQKAAAAKPSATPMPAAVEAAKAIDAEEAALPKAQASLLWSRLEPGWAALPDAKRVAYGEAILALDPAHAPVTAWFTSLVPAEFQGRFTWREWSGWRRVLGSTGALRFPPAAGTKSRDMSPIEKELARAASIWRKDVVGVVRDGYVLIARPPAGPGLERAATTSSAVFAFLEDLFRTPTPLRTDPEPVAIWVHADRNDLWSHLSPVEERWADSHLRQRDGKKREHAAFFSPAEGLTKILSPDVPGSAEREAEIREDLAFFTTYHWLYARCPRFRWRERQESMGAPCFFIATDFVDAVCGGAVDPKTGAWGLPDHKRPIFTNWRALKGIKKVLPWERVLDATARDFEALVVAAGKEDEAATTAVLAYVVQASLAAYWFVHGADEGVRRRFADHVTDYFLGQAEGKTVRSVYGLGAEEIGGRIEAWAAR